jgi:hypothetical protein
LDSCLEKKGAILKALSFDIFFAHFWGVRVSYLSELKFFYGVCGVEIAYLIISQKVRI